MPATSTLRSSLFVALLALAAACSGADTDERRDDATAATDSNAPESLFPDTAGPGDEGESSAEATPDDSHAGLPDATGPDLAEPEAITPDVAADPGGGTPDTSTPPIHYCKPGTEFVYVVNKERHLMRFDPIPKTFTDQGQMTCQTGLFAGTPFSMAIDRQAVAWVLYDDGQLYRVSTDDASCTPTGFASGQHGFTTFGMGFASNSAGSNDETLFLSNAVYGAGTSALGTLSFPGLAVSEIGPTEAGIGSAELSGNGLGELWSFFPNGSLVARVDKATGALSERIDLPPGVISDARAWAFATWGGDFYLFFAGQWDASSSVYRVKKDGTFETLLTNTGWNITGAGVSSCAPTGG